MTQIVVTLEEGTNLSIISNAIKMIKGVKNTIVTNWESESDQSKTIKRLNALDKLAGSISINMVDMDDNRTKYLMSK